MSHWTKPRAYIINMDGRQTAQLAKVAAERTARAYAEYVQGLAASGHKRTP